MRRTPVVPRPLGIGPLDLAEVHVELGYYEQGSDVSLWNVAQWDTAGAKWQGAAPLHDISCDVLSVSIVQGRDQPLDRFRTGTATVLVDDPDGTLSPWSTASVPGTYATIRPGIDLVVWVDILGGGAPPYPRFRGVVDSITDEWPEPSPDLDAPHRVTFHALDYLQDLAAYDGVELAPAGAGETTGNRIGRILNNAGFARESDVDAGTVTVQATTLAKNALDEAGLTVDTERGALWVDRDGVLQFRDRNGLVDNPAYTTVQAVFGEAGGGGGEIEGEVCYSDVKLISDASKIRNIVTVAREGGTATTQIDQTSRALYGPRTYRRLDLIHDTDAESVVIADEMLDQFAYADNRVGALVVDLVAHPVDLDAVLPLDVLYLIELHRLSRGVQIVAELQIQAITERITPDTWEIEFSTFQAANVFSVARWDTFAQWDVGLWGY